MVISIFKEQKPKGGFSLYAHPPHEPNYSFNSIQMLASLICISVAGAKFKYCTEGICWLLCQTFQVPPEVFHN